MSKAKPKLPRSFPSPATAFFLESRASHSFPHHIQQPATRLHRTLAQQNQPTCHRPLASSAKSSKVQPSRTLPYQLPWDDSRDQPTDRYCRRDTIPQALRVLIGLCFSRYPTSECWPRGKLTRKRVWAQFPKLTSSSL